MDPLEIKIRKAVHTMLYRDRPPRWFYIGLACLMGSLTIATTAIVTYTFSGKPQQPVPSGPKTYTPVLRLFMHTPQRLSFFVPTETEVLKLVTVESPAITWIADVPAGQPLYVVEGTVKRSGTVFTSTEIAVHVHAASDVNATGWDNGKFGHGTTIVVE